MTKSERFDGFRARALYPSYASEQAGGGWTAYMWAKSGGSEAANKVSFAMKVAGTDYEVAAGVYADKKVENFKLVE